jgi:hypothetical protein
VGSELALGSGVGSTVGSGVGVGAMPLYQRSGLSGSKVSLM